VASLHGQAIHRLRLEGTRVIYDEPIKFDLDRLRDLVELPNGHIALLTDLGTIVLLRNADAYNKTSYLDASRQQRRTTDMSAEERAFAVAGRYANAANTGTVVAEASEHLPPAAAHGETVFSANCAVCHAIESSMSLAGPSLKGVIGRRVGSAQFAYSAALAGRHETWTSHRIVDFVVRPDGMYPGTSMPPVALTPDLQRDLVSYLDARHRQ
jgi:cytochrome c